MYNEILKYDINNENFEFALMKTPVADGAVETSITYTIGEDQYIAIPESSTKKELAKDFIKLMISVQRLRVGLNERGVRTERARAPNIHRVGEIQQSVVGYLGVARNFVRGERLKEKLQEIIATEKKLRRDKDFAKKCAIPENCYLLGNGEILCYPRGTGDSRYPYSADRSCFW